MAMRLVAGQNDFGGWTYTCAKLSDVETKWLVAFLNQNKPDMPNPLAGDAEMAKGLGTGAKTLNPLDSSTPLPNPISSGADLNNPLGKSTTQGEQSALVKGTAKTPDGKASTQGDKSDVVKGKTVTTKDTSDTKVASPGDIKKKP